MKITYCGVQDTFVKIFGEKVPVKTAQEVEMEEKDALQLLNSYNDIFAPSLNKDAVKAKLSANKIKEEKRQEQIDIEIKERLEEEEAAKEEALRKLKKDKA